MLICLFAIFLNFFTESFKNFVETCSPSLQLLECVPLQSFVGCRLCCPRILNDPISFLVHHLVHKQVRTSKSSNNHRVNKGTAAQVRGLKEPTDHPIRLGRGEIATIKRALFSTSSLSFIS